MLHKNKTIRECTTSIEQVVATSKEVIKSSIETMEKYTNKKQKDIQFQEGDLIKLVAKYIYTLHVSKKLIEHYLGPFKVLAHIRQNIYKLELPIKYKRLYYTFYVSLLEAYHM